MADPLRLRPHSPDLRLALLVRPAAGHPIVRHLREKAGLNRAILDADPGELLRQLTYKTSWYGSQLAILDAGGSPTRPVQKNPRLALSHRTFHCTICGLTMDRDFNAARDIEPTQNYPTSPLASGPVARCPGFRHAVATAVTTWWWRVPVGDQGGRRWRGGVLHGRN
ncbi:zinc ribbon domain-containing protein [Streptomyces albospinus]|uniref:zinc ribbon domain-containing protein n=1 Tax=Streptomyces albospinus TaxID=285515 RepID=UPI00166F835D|nr:zinc ribbon domain-containing protein [Streptomyces albospinus]